MTMGISQIVGTGEGAGGARVTVYRALRRIICTPCGGTIMEGELFTRRSINAQGVRLLSRCQKCSPFTLGMDEEAKRPRSKMLDALLAPESEQGGRLIVEERGRARRGQGGGGEEARAGSAAQA